MTWHNTVTIDLHPLIFTTIIQCTYHRFKVTITNKDINPIYCCKANKINAILITKFILSTHLPIF